MPSQERSDTEVLMNDPERRYVDKFNEKRVRHFARVGGSLRWATFLRQPDGSLVLRGEQGHFRENTPYQLTVGARLGFVEQANEQS